MSMAEQVRKSTTVPYVAHLLAVAATVLEYGGDEDMAIAGLLHDAAEDQGGGAPARRHPQPLPVSASPRSFTACSDSLVEAGEAKRNVRARRERYLRHLEAATATRCWFRLPTQAQQRPLDPARPPQVREIGRRCGSASSARLEDQLWYYGALAAATAGCCRGSSLRSWPRSSNTSGGSRLGQHSADADSAAPLFDGSEIRP